MKRLLLTAAALSLFAVACNRDSDRSMDNRVDDSNVQREEALDVNSHPEAKPYDDSMMDSDVRPEADVQREEDLSEGAIESGSDVNINRGSGSDIGTGTGSDSSMGTRRGTGTDAGSSDASGMGMDE